MRKNVLHGKLSVGDVWKNHADQIKLRVLIKPYYVIIKHVFG